MLSDEEAATKISELPGQNEDAHYKGDSILCELLRELGYPKTADAFYAKSSDWWYA